ncbi:ROK family transcriptional regulator [Yinghuangia aomiensis]|uniref:ROK family transcriptional regulator n=1 Tax=Yinghuangia aomiensis TaxID=676205 RepID=A0ABP9I6L7_9ACTN
MITREAPTHLGTMRDRNLALVLGEIARHQPVTRARLAELTGLTKTTVAAQVGVLTRLQLVEGAGPVREGGRGRPGAPLSLASGPVAGLGLEVNGHYLAACVLDMNGVVRGRAHIARNSRDRPVGETLDALVRMARRVIEEAAEAGFTVMGTTVAVPGVVDRAAGTVNAPNIGWQAVTVEALLADSLPPQPIGVRVENEANLGALGELWYGAGRGSGSYVYVSGEAGIGAGLVVDGELFRGAHGAAGEIGHVVVDPSGPSCACGGRGCVEQVAGLDAVLRAAAIESVDAGGAGHLPDATAELLRRLETGDALAAAAVEAAGSGMAVALIAAVNLLDPDTVVLGGLHALLAPWMAPHIESALSRSGGRLRGSVPTIRAAALASESAVRGGAGTVVARVLADPMVVS